MWYKRSRGFQKPPLGAQIDWGHPLARNLIGCWLFNEERGRILNDIATGKTGRVIGAVDWAPLPKIGSGLFFNGSTTYVDTNLQFLDSFSKITIEVWYSTVNLASRRDLVGQNDSCEFFLGSPQGNFWTASPGTDFWFNSPLNNQVNQLVAVTTGQGKFVYNNGILLLSDTSSSTDYGSNTIYSVKMGAFVSATSGNYFFGTMGLVRIWTRALSLSEIYWLYREPYAFIQGP